MVVLSDGPLIRIIDLPGYILSTVNQNIGTNNAHGLQVTRSDQLGNEEMKILTRAMQTIWKSKNGIFTGHKPANYFMKIKICYKC